MLNQPPINLIATWNGSIMFMPLTPSPLSSFPLFEHLTESLLCSCFEQKVLSVVNLFPPRNESNTQLHEEVIIISVHLGEKLNSIQQYILLAIHKAAPFMFVLLHGIRNLSRAFSYKGEKEEEENTCIFYHYHPFHYYDRTYCYTLLKFTSWKDGSFTGRSIIWSREWY